MREGVVSLLCYTCFIIPWYFLLLRFQRVGGHCLLGQHTVYERRKSEDCCFNGEEYEREVNISACTCGGDDFEW